MIAQTSMFKVLFTKADVCSSATLFPVFIEGKKRRWDSPRRVEYKGTNGISMKQYYYDSGIGDRAISGITLQFH